MSYIGNLIYQSAFVTDQFSGTGSQTAYTMSVAPAGTTNVLVVVSGVVQDPSTYGVVGNTLTFSAAPPSGTGNISCRYLGVPVTGVTTTAYRTVTEFTATAGQTTFTPPSYNVGFINVYLNGVLLGSADYTATNGTTVVLTTGASVGNLVTVESFSISSVANAIPNAAGSVSNSNLATASITSDKFASTTGSGAVVLATSPTLVTPALGTPSAINLSNATALPASALPAGAVKQVVNATYGGYVTTTSTSFTDLGLSATITPSSTSSKILVINNLAGTGSYGTTIACLGVSLVRNGSTLFIIDGNVGYTVIGTGERNMGAGGSCSYLDSPATTSAVTYKIQIANVGGSGTAMVGNYYSGTVRPTCTLTLMEIAG